MSRRAQAVIDTPLGRLRLAAENGALVAVDFTRAAPVPPRDAVTREAARQIREYFAGRRRQFALPLAPAGTAFQRRVWRALAAIPFGRTLTYGELARRLGTSPRAVGGACRANPLPLVVPCHRVVAVSGPGGYAGHTRGPVAARKRALLRHEGVLP